MIETRQRTTTKVVLVAVAAAVGLLLVPLPKGSGGGWVGELLNLGHVPLFAAFVMVLAFWGLRTWLATSTAVALAVAAEWFQPWTGRHASPRDLLFGLFGIAIGVAWVWAFRSRRWWHGFATATVVSLLLAAWPVAQTAPVLWKAFQTARQFPVLVDFQRSGGFYYRGQARVEAVEWDDRYAGQWTFFPGDQSFSYITLRPVVGDWTGYTWLCWEITVPEEGIQLEWKVEDDRETSYEGRFNGHWEYAEGHHRDRILLQTLANDATPPLDLRRIRRLEWFMAPPIEPKSVVIHRIWLE